MATAENTELVDAFEQFYRNYYREEIGDLAQNYPGEKRSLYIDWDDLYRYDPDLADDFLSQPEQLQEYAEEALRIYDLPVDVSLGRAHVRPYNLPETTGIRDIRSRHVGQLLSVSGIVRKATDVRPKIEEAAFECQRCGTLNYIPQSSGDFQEPHECQGCERQGPFNVNFDQSEFVDAQKLRVQESPEGLRGGETPQAVDLTIEDDITGEVTAGDHVTVTGILHLQQQGNQQEKSPIFDIYMDGITVEIEDEQFEDMEISEDEKAEIIELSQSPDIYEKMIGSMAPSIYGYDQEKLAIILQLFSGVTKHLPDGSRIRGDLHMLLIGDPGTGKCVKGDTTVTLADGRERPIKEIVEANLTDPSPVDDGVYDSLDQDVVSLGSDGTSELRTATKVWKREAPDRMYQIRTASGYELEVTPSHPLFVSHPSGYEARVAEELRVGDSVAISPDRPDKPLATDGGAVSEAATVSHIGERSVEKDQIESIDAVDPDYDWVYDLEVEGTHSYLSNNIFSHNSQLLQYVREISPRSVYTSGKGSSAAGLCVTGDTFVHTKEGIRQIQDLATDKHPEPVDDDESVRHHEEVYTFDRESGEMGVRESSHVWRMPEKPCRRIETAHGKELETSVNTPVLVAGDTGIEWRQIDAVEPGDRVAVPSYDTVESSSPSVREFLELTNEKLKPTDESIEFLRSQLCETFGTLRDAARELDLSEDFIYDSLSNRFIPIDRLDRLLDAIDADRSDVEFDRAMLRHGDPVDLPDEFSPDLLYLIGLVFGDGDISLARRGENRGMVRLSNSDEALLERAIDIIEGEFGKTVEIERQADRVPSIRLNSATVARLFANVGMQTPKAELSLDHRLTTAEHADAFLRGLFDADGCVVERDTGSSTIQFSTISETLAEQVQLMLETLGVRARSRERDRRGTSVRADGFEIESKEIQTHLTIYGENRDRFAEYVGFGSAAKAAALDRIIGESDAPADTVPVGGALESIEVSTDQRYVNFNCGDEVARSTARSMIATAEPVVDTTPAEEVLDAELVWDEVVAAVDTGQKEVFDLTVPDTHNFIGNGIVTHNTAAAVRDDFGDGQQWTLEAGAMVLADKGVAAIDELDKMRCVTGNSLVHTQDGIRRIDDLAADAAEDGEIETLENGRTIRDVDLTVWTLTDDERLVKRPVSAVHEYDAPQELLDVTLETGESLAVTPDHPFITLQDGDRSEVPAGELSGEEWVYIPDNVPTAAADGGIAAHKSRMDVTTDLQRLTPEHGAILGYLAGDGNVFCDRDEGVYGIRFINAEQQLIEDFERACRFAFDAEPVRHPSDQRNGVMVTRLHGKEYLQTVLDAGMNLDVYDGKCLPEAVTRSSSDTKAAFVRALADLDGSVGERCVKIHSSSYDLLLGVKMLLTEFGITSQIQHRPNEGKRDMYLLVITSDASLRRYNRRIGFTLDRKQAALEQACDRTTGDRTIVDVLPDIGSYLESMRDSLRLYVSECGLDDATYCNFENSDANVSFDCAEQILAAFEERRGTAENDHERLSEELSWGELEELTERYHVSQSELAAETEYSQPQISRYWATDDALRRIVQSRLSSIVESIATTDLSRLRQLASGDVKWRRVESVSRVSRDDKNGNTDVLRGQLADLVNASPEDARSTAQALLQEEPTLESGDEIAAALDRYGIPQWRVAEHLDVDQATVSRWIRDQTPHDSERLRAACIELINQRKSQLRSQVTAIECRQETKVYDLTVEETHNFLANGMVVHNSEDRSAMHEALEQQSISISKAGINATLKSRCSLLGAANPKYGRFDQYESIGEQIDLEPALISRFDLIFTVTDQPDEEEDSRLAEHILQTNFAGELNTQREELSAPNVTREQVESQTEEVEPVIDAELLRKYVAHAKSNVYPTMSDEAKEAIRDFYVDLRSKGTDEDAPVPVTARKLEALVRLAEASARVRLSDTVEIEDAERVIEIVRSCLQDIGVDPETGQYDADVVETGTSKSQRDRIKNIKQLIADVEEDYEDGAPIDVVLDRADEIGMDQSKAEREIEKLKQKGEVYEPNLDHLRTA
ncbi:LAGLIDADG family homing endonuclease [Natranaeroarchaeum aerophilus]|uniref:DNA helicase n=1 Tax=Natranaeroarchaeum aerophilus TaxID=2917711 RepID=A0AAE3FPB6_9EURY|nr:LAGLIDADG family homing endonuclease [Natranaeroarchaeum aerophilus]MCL9812164.1 hypothetical protein [Natranaeroarchaeum aerophilus]